jgi:hypothetical protein
VLYGLCLGIVCGPFRFPPSPVRIAAPLVSQTVRASPVGNRCRPRQ